MPAAKPVITEPAISVRIRKTNAHFRRMREGGVEFGAGKFFLLIDITAIKEDIFIPISIASGKKPTGFIYEIVGTKAGMISTTDISCEGKEISQITLGTILYCKIPATKTGTFRIIVETRGKIGGVYNIVINRINFKHDPSDARYGKFVEDLSSESVKFR
jgi:hypothetical protein